MSTEDQNKAVVTLQLGVDVDAFIEDMVSGTNHNEFMPGRRVELHNEKLDSLRNVDFVLTKEEAEQKDYTFAEYLDAARAQYVDEDAVLVANEAFRNKDITLFTDQSQSPEA